MLIAVSDFPSGGYSYNIGSIDIHPMTFKDIIKYNEYLSNTYLQKLYRDIKTLDDDLGQEVVNQLLFYDLDFIVFTKKAFSIPDSTKITLPGTCQDCGSTNNYNFTTDDLRYTDFTEVVKTIKGIEINNNKYDIAPPKIGEVRKILDKMLQYKEDVNPTIFRLCTCFRNFLENPNQIKSLIENAIKEDIINLQYIDKFLSGMMKEVKVPCSNCGKEVVIRLDESMTDMFRFLGDNCRFTGDKIIISKTV